MRAEPSKAYSVASPFAARVFQEAASAPTLGAARPSTRTAPVSFDLSERTWLLISCDLAACLVAATAAIAVWGLVADRFSLHWLTNEAHWVLALTAGWCTTASLAGSYRSPLVRSRSLGLVVSIGVILFGCYLVVFFFAPRLLLPRVVVLGYLFFVTALAAAVRTGLDWAHASRFQRRVLVLGATEWSRDVAALLADQTAVDVAGFIHHDCERPDSVFESTGVALSRFADETQSSTTLVDRAEGLGASEIVLAGRAGCCPAGVDSILACVERGIAVTGASDLYESLTGRIFPFTGYDGIESVLPISHSATRPTHLALKRIVDILWSSVGVGILIAASPLVALAIKLDSKGPALYRQTRNGRRGRAFTIWKFRTMREGAEEDGEAVWASVDDPRVTRVGRWLRRTRLDELPQLWNVLKGEMSLVGPRPERPEIERELEERIPFYKLRLTVKPGIASWHAINATYVDSLREAQIRLEYDLYYIKHQSPWLDLQIMLKAAVHTVLLRGQ